MARAKRRSVYNFVLGLTISGLILSCTNVAGSMVFEVRERTAIQDIQEDKFELEELTKACTGESFTKQLNEKLSNLEEEKTLGKIDEQTYQTKLEYLKSDAFKDDYMKTYYNEIYQSQIIKLRTEISEKVGEVYKLEEHLNFINTIGIAGATVSAYASESLLKSNEDEKQLEKSC